MKGYFFLKEAFDLNIMAGDVLWYILPFRYFGMWYIRYVANDSTNVYASFEGFTVTATLANIFVKCHFFINAWRAIKMLIRAQLYLLIMFELVEWKVSLTKIVYTEKHFVLKWLKGRHNILIILYHKLWSFPKFFSKDKCLVNS